MMTKDELLMLEQELLDEIELLKEELQEVREALTDAAEDETDNPHWSVKDTEGGRLCNPMQTIRQKLLDGTRAEYLYANGYEPFSYKGFFATLTEEVDPDVMRMYREAQTRHFAGAIVGLGFVLAKCYDKDGKLIDGYRIPWYGNFGPYKATMKLQDDWASPSKLNRVRGQAERFTRRLDRAYQRAVGTGRLIEFSSKHPWYISAGNWHGDE